MAYKIKNKQKEKNLVAVKIGREVEIYRFPTKKKKDEFLNIIKRRKGVEYLETI